MNQWAFVIAAYAVSAAGVIGLVAASWFAMRRAEDRFDELTRR
ncbi:MAG: heme exporter protein CcmD [Sphingomicrobium sp.]